MTFVIAKIIDPSAGKVTLMSNTKVTDRHDGTYNRRTLSNPCQKVVILDDDLVVGFAGDTPASAVKRVVELRGHSVREVEEALCSFSAELHNTAGASKSFLVVERKPEPRIMVISNGEQEDRTQIGTGWIGDRAAFKAFSEVFQDDSAPASLGLEQRFFGAMSVLVSLDDVETVGGYLVRVSGSCDKPMRFMADAGYMMPGDTDGTLVQKPGGQTALEFSLSEGADPTRHVRFPIPGTGSTYSAIAHYIPEANAAWLHTHERPHDSAKSLTVQSLSELVEVARNRYGQYLDPAGAERALQGDRPLPSALYMRPNPIPRHPDPSLQALPTASHSRDAAMIEPAEH